MIAVWRDEMSVGNLAIDEEHIYWFGLFNALELAVLHERDPDMAQMILSKLQQYTAKHFADEERIQHTVHFPERDEHALEHRDFLKRLQGAVDDLSGLLSADTKSAHDRKASDREHQIIAGMRKWMVEHVVNSDVKMKTSLAGYPPDLT